MEILRLGEIEKLTILEFSCECREKEHVFEHELLVQDIARIELGEELFHKGRMCKFCSINIDIEDQDILQFFHGTCWQEYRRNGLIYPMPKYA